MAGAASASRSMVVPGDRRAELMAEGCVADRFGSSVKGSKRALFEGSFACSPSSFFALTSGAAVRRAVGGSASVTVSRIGCGVFTLQSLLLSIITFIFHNP